MKFLLSFIFFVPVIFLSAQDFECFPFDPFDPLKQLTKSSFGATIVDIQAVPVAVDIRQPFHFTVELDQPVDSLVIEDFLGSVVYVGAGNKLFLDDGEGNDQKAGDLLYTCSNMMPNQVGRTDVVTTSNGKFDRLRDIVLYENGQAETLSFDIAAGIRFMNLDNIEVPQVKQLNDTVQLTEYVLNMTYDYTYGGFPYDALFLFNLAEYVGPLLEDDNHFLFVNSANPTPGSPAGSNSNPGNTSMGLGQTVNSNPSLALRKFPSIITHWLTYNGEAIGLWIHEVNHRHCAYVDELGLSEPGHHWGLIERPTNAFGAGNTAFATELINIGGDTFELSREGLELAFSDLELYLHGQISIDEVDFPIRTLRNSNRINSTTYTGELVEISKEDWLNELGPRVPEFEDNDRKVTTVVFSKELLSPEELAYFHRGAQAIELTEPFESIAGNEQQPASSYSDGLATYTTKLRYVDNDGDGDNYFSDCDDNEPQVSSLNEETTYNGIDDDCDPLTLDDDLDGDGYLIADDCDDTNSDVNPDQTEIPYNGLDDDCDEQSLDDDLDQDGFVLAEDCNDEDPGVNPDTEDIPNNGIDEDCDGMDAVSSVHNLNGVNVQIYPNPVENWLKINTAQNSDLELKLYTHAGKLVLSATNQTKLDVTELASGTYLLALKHKNKAQRIVEKIIVK